MVSGHHLLVDFLDLLDSYNIETVSATLRPTRASPSTELLFGDTQLEGKVVVIFGLVFASGVACGWWTCWMCRRSGTPDRRLKSD